MFVFIILMTCYKLDMLKSINLKLIEASSVIVVVVVVLLFYVHDKQHITTLLLGRLRPPSQLTNTSCTYFSQ